MHSLTPLTAYESSPPLVAPNFTALMQVRVELLSNCDSLPDYLLLPEIERVLLAAPNQHAAVMFNLLWQTGARINELLALKSSDIQWLQGHVMSITLRTLKQRTGNGNRPKRGRPAEGAKRAVTVACPILHRELIQYQRTFKRSKDKPLFVNPQTNKPWSAQMVRNWCKQASDTLASQGQPLPIVLSPHVFRHSHAINLVLHHVDINTIKHSLGHRSLRSTEIYLNIWQSEQYYKKRHVPFRMPIEAQSAGEWGKV